MIVAIGKVELHIPHSNNLKAKRKVISSLCGKIRSKFEISVSEIDHQDLWQRSSIGFGMVSSDRGVARAVFEKVFAIIDSNPDCEVTQRDYKIFDPEKE